MINTKCTMDYNLFIFVGSEEFSLVNGKSESIIKVIKYSFIQGGADICRYLVIIIKSSIDSIYRYIIYYICVPFYRHFTSSSSQRVHDATSPVILILKPSQRAPGALPARMSDGSRETGFKTSWETYNPVRRRV